MNKTHRFGAAYLASLLFNTSPDDMGSEDLEDLGLPEDLLNEILAWDRSFQATFCDEYPPDSGLKTIEEVINHNKEGMKLCQALQAVLGPQTTVEFVPYK